MFRSFNDALKSAVAVPNYENKSFKKSVTLTNPPRDIKRFDLLRRFSHVVKQVVRVPN